VDDVTLEEFEEFAIARLRSELAFLPFLPSSLLPSPPPSHPSPRLRADPSRRDFLLSVLALVESSFIRGLPHAQLTALFKTASAKYLPLAANTAKSTDHDKERKKDVVSHFVLRLAFCGR